MQFMRAPLQLRPNSKQLQMMPIVYILVLLLVSHAHSQCTPALYSANLTTDLVSLPPTTEVSTAYNYSFAGIFGTVPQVALAIVQLSADSQVGQGNSLFYIMAQNITTSGLKISTYAQGLHWIVSRVRLIASTNSQLQLGSASLQLSKSTTGTSTSIMVFQISIQASLPVNNNQIARSFINGLSLYNSLPTLRITNTTLAQDKLTVTVDLGNSQINTIWVSFIVFNLNNGAFSAYGGYTSINSNSSDTVDLLKGFSAVQNVFYGINAFQFDSASPSSNLSVSIDSNFLLSYSSSSGNFVISYLFIGYPSNVTCSACKSKEMSNYFNGVCLSKCGEDTISLTVAGGGQLCRPCPEGTGLVVVNGSCVCPPNSRFINNRCVLAVPSLAGLTVQLANPQSVAVKSASTGVINLLPDGTINQNLNFAAPAPQSIPTVTQLASITTTNTVVSSPTFIPSSASSQPPVPNPQTQSLFTIASTPPVVCSILNSYFNGNECVCKVTYVYENGKCIVPQFPIINPVKILPVVSNSSVACQANAYFDGSTCLCNKDYYMQNNICVKCQANSQWNGLACICNKNYYSLNGICVSQKTVCPINSQDNGLGQCICNSNYAMINNSCQPTQGTCPSNSLMVNNVCTCLSGFLNISGVCSQCPSGAFWSSASKTCVYVCGVNSIFNQTLGSCACVTGYGIDSSGSCQQCAGNYYLFNGYCATCPSNDYYNSTSKQCTCALGYILSQQGICLPKCQSNEVFNQLTTACDCIVNYARIGSVCLPCPSNSFYTNGQCIGCPANSVLLNGKCSCTTGYISNSYGLCVQCSSLPNAFMVNNYCATCANNQIYNSTTGTCQCPFGKVLSGSLCVSSCNSDQLLDKNGNCYTCGMNEVIFQGSCACIQGYVLDGCGGCKLNCNSGSFVFMGQCAICPINMNYFQQIAGCVCPNGYYLDPISNYCQQSTFFVPVCSNGTFYDNATQKCAVCSSVCTSCVSSSSCTSCQSGFSLNGGICQPICGDGLVRGGQTCDSGSSYQAGCLNCQTLTGYTCTGQPSVCFAITPTPTPPLATNATAKTQLSQRGNISLNSNNIFLTLQTNPTFTFPNPTVMQSFIQSSFVNTLRPSTYCVQQPSPNLNSFDCLLIYPTGIPNTKFNVFFSFNYQGQSANTTITIDPLLYVTTSRSPVPASSQRASS